MGRPDILVIVLDSLRVDRVSGYGHTHPTTPHLDNLAERSTRFASAVTPAPWTLPSHCSMFTGLYPSEHGVTNGFLDRSVELTGAHRTLVEELADSGYLTAGFSNNPWVGQLSDLHRGFDEFTEWDLEVSRSGLASIHSTTDQAFSRGHRLLGLLSRQPMFLLKRRFFTTSLIDRATQWLTWAGDTPDPSFTFLNLMEAHSPYFPPRRAFRELSFDEPNFIEPRILNTKLLAYVMGRADLSISQRRRILEFYDASVRYQDEQVGRLIGHLKTLGAFDDTLIVVTSDHGKTLGEYARDGTPPHYTRPINTDVPLVVKMPGQSRGAVVDTPAELARLPALLWAGTGSPEEHLCVDDVALVEDFVPHTGRSTKPITRWRVVTDGTHRLIASDDGREYFDHAGTLIDEPPEGERLRQALSRRIDELTSTGESPDASRKIPAGVEGQLHDLGYLE